jgi:hypothetical protein
MPELLNCPFCGGDAVPVQQRWSGREFHSVKCGDCLIWNDSRSGNEESAAEVWNTRPEDNLIKEAVEALTEAREAILGAARDTLWCSDKWPAETVVDHIDATLTKLTGEKQ